MVNQFRRKFLSLTLILCLLLSLATPAMAASNDIAGHWAESVLSEWIGLGLVAGDGNGTYRPNDSITRAEFFTLVNNWKGYTAESDKVKNYTDVSPGKWYYKQVAIALGAGYITGTSETTMSPEAKITRQEAMIIVARIAGLQAASDTSVLENVKDGTKVASWAKGFAAAVINDGLISGGGDGNINPLNNITRAETVVLLNKVRVDARSYAFAGTYGPASGTKTVKNVEIGAPGVTLQNMTVTGDLTIAKSVGEGEATLNNVTVQGKLNVLGGGLNSIYLNNCTVKELIVEKGKVRIVLADGSTVSFARMGGDDDIIELGGNTKIETLTVTGDGTTIKAGAGVTINTLNAQAYGTTLETQSGTKIGTANLDGETTITGAGTITTANVNVAGCTIDTKPGTTNVASGVTAEVGGQPITGTTPPTGGGDGGGPGPSTPVFQSHSVTGKTVPFGTQEGDLNLPASVTLTANTGATGTANVTWIYGTYNPNTADNYPITGTLTGATVSWAPTTITVTVTVQAALTVTGGTTVSDVTVKSTDDEAAAKAKLPTALTLTLSDNSTVQVSLTWTCGAGYSQAASAVNRFTATITGLPAYVSPVPAVTATVTVSNAASVATTISLTATPGSVQRPAADSEVTVVLSYSVRDQYGEEMTPNPSFTWGGSYGGVDWGLSGSDKAVEIDDTCTESEIVVNVTEADTLLSKSVTIYITDDPVVATSIEVTSFVASIALPSAGNTTTAQFTGVVKDQNGAVLSGEAVEFEIKTPVTGVTVATDGLVTVDNTAANGASFIVVASYSGLTSIEKTVTINKAVSVATSIGAISGSASLTLPAGGGANATAAYTAQVLDQYGAVMTASVTWGVSGTPTGVSISASGMLTVTSAASAGSVTVTADYGSLTQVTKTVAIAKDINKVATTVTITDQGSGNITLPASVPSAGANATRTFTAAATDQYGDAIASPTISWNVTSAAGVSISGGVVTVTSAASVGSITVTATCGTASDTETVTIAKAASALTQITVSGPSSVVQNVGGTYTAACVDQYGSTITPTITWSIDSPPANVSIGPSTGVLTVGLSVPDNTTFTVKATSGSVNGTLDVVVNNPNMPTGLKWAKDSGGAIHMSFSKSTESTAAFFTLEEYKDGSLTRTTYIPATNISTNAYTLINGAGVYTFKVIACSGSLSNPTAGTVLATSAASPAMTVTSSAAVTGFTAEYSSTTKKITLTNATSFSGVYEGYCSTLEPKYAMISSSSPRTTVDMEFPGGGDATGGLTIHQFTNTAINPDGSGTVTVSAAQSPAITVTAAVARAPQVTNLHFEAETAYGSKLLKLVWDAPANAASTIDSYKIEYSLDGGSTWQGNMQQSNNSYYIYDNTPGAYTFRVTSIAKSGAGLSDSNPAVCGKTLTISTNGSIVSISKLETRVESGYIYADATITASSDTFLMVTYQTLSDGSGTRSGNARANISGSSGLLSVSRHTDSGFTFQSGSVTVQKFECAVLGDGNATITLTPPQNPAVVMPAPADPTKLATNMQFEMRTGNILGLKFTYPTNVEGVQGFQLQGKKSTDSSWPNSYQHGAPSSGSASAVYNPAIDASYNGAGVYSYRFATYGANPPNNPLVMTYFDKTMTATVDPAVVQVTSAVYTSENNGTITISGPGILNNTEYFVKIQKTDGSGSALSMYTTDSTLKRTNINAIMAAGNVVVVEKVTSSIDGSGNAALTITTKQAGGIPITGYSAPTDIPSVALSVTDGELFATIQPNPAYAGKTGSLNIGFVKQGDSPQSNNAFTITASGISYSQISGSTPYTTAIGDTANWVQLSNYFNDGDTLQVCAFAFFTNGENPPTYGNIWRSDDIYFEKTAALPIDSITSDDSGITVTMKDNVIAGQEYGIRGTERAEYGNEGTEVRIGVTGSGKNLLLPAATNNYSKVNYVQVGMGAAEELGNGDISVSVTALGSKKAVGYTGAADTDLTNISFATVTADNLNGWMLSANVEIPVIQFDVPATLGSYDSFFLRRTKDGESGSGNTAGDVLPDSRVSRNIMDMEYGPGIYRYAVALTTGYDEPDEGELSFDNVLTIDKSSTALAITSGSYIYKSQDDTWSYYDVTLLGDFTVGRVYSFYYSVGGGTRYMGYAACATAGELVILDFNSNNIAGEYTFQVFEFVSLYANGEDATLTYAESTETLIALTSD